MSFRRRIEWPIDRCHESIAQAEEVLERMKTTLQNSEAILMRSRRVCELVTAALGGVSIGARET